MYAFEVVVRKKDSGAHVRKFFALGHTWYRLRQHILSRYDQNYDVDYFNISDEEAAEVAFEVVVDPQGVPGVLEGGSFIPKSNGAFVKRRKTTNSGKKTGKKK